MTTSMKLLGNTSSSRSFFLEKFSVSPSPLPHTQSIHLRVLISQWFCLWPCPSSKKKCFRCSHFFSGSVFSLRTHIRAVELHNMLGDDEVRSRLDAQSGCWSESLACAVSHICTNRDFLDSNFSEIKNRCKKKKRASRASKRVEQEEKNAVLLFLLFFVDESGERREI